MISMMGVVLCVNTVNVNWIDCPGYREAINTATGHTNELWSKLSPLHTWHHTRFGVLKVDLNSSSTLAFCGYGWVRFSFGSLFSLSLPGSILASLIGFRLGCSNLCSPQTNSDHWLFRYSDSRGISGSSGRIPQPNPSAVSHFTHNLIISISYINLSTLKFAD
jgi:hypothetical protein